MRTTYLTAHSIKVTLWSIMVLCVCPTARSNESIVPIDGRSKSSSPPFRVWVDDTGMHRASAAFISYLPELQRVRLSKSNGNIVSVPLDRLSAADQRYVAHLAHAASAPVTNPVRQASATYSALQQSPVDSAPRSSYATFTGFMYTGRRGTQAFDLTLKTGKALYRHLDDYADSKDLHNMWEDANNYYFREVNNPGWYWRFAKHPTYTCCGCYWYCLGYRVAYVQDVGPNPPRVEFRYYARRDRIKGIDSSERGATVEAEAF